VPAEGLVVSGDRAARCHLDSRPPAAFRVVVDGRVVAADATVVVVASVESYGP
jgi:hypothetical protein